MTPDRPGGTRRAAIGLLSALVLGVAAGSAAAAQPSETKECCFANWRYAGGCVVRIPRDQACTDVLATLNNPMSMSTGYCRDTDVRGGWVEMSCTQSSDVSAGAPTRLRTEEPPLELAPTERKLRLHSEEPGPGLQARQPTYLTPVEPHALTPKEPSDVLLGPSLPGW
jgi:hypothetical protein